MKLCYPVGMENMATINHLVEATCGLVVLLSAQFLNEDFSPNVGYLALQSSGDGMESSIGGYFRVKYPNWNAKDRYDFNWQEIKDKPNIIQCHDYNSIG